MLSRTLAATVAALALAAASASASSISYIKDGDVWLSTPDGARQHRVTATGGYDFASQADDGTIIALKARRLHRLQPDGTLLADFATPVSFDSGPNNSTFYGPFDPAISPDGTKVAYTYYWQYYYYDPTCNGGWGCTRQRLEGGTAYSRADKLTGWDEQGLGRQSGWLWPSWIGNTQTLISEPTVAFGNEDAIVDTVGDGTSTILRWFSDTGARGLRDGEMTTQRTKMAFVGTDPATADDAPRENQIRVYRMTGQAPAVPEICFWFGDPDGRFESPSWSPDGGALAWSSPRGIEVAEVPSMTGGCQVPAQGSQKLIEGGRFPDWGPADVPAAPAPPPPPPPPPGDETGGGNTGGDTTTGGGTTNGGGSTSSGGGTTSSGGGTTSNGGGTTTNDSSNPGGGAGKPGGGSIPLTPNSGNGGGQSTPLVVSAAQVKLGRALKNGLGVTISTPGPGQLIVSAKAGRTTVGRGRATAPAAGPVKVRIAFNRKARAKLHGKRSVTLQLLVTLRPAGGGAPQLVRIGTLLRR
jgi:hypothetical protein